MCFRQNNKKDNPIRDKEFYFFWGFYISCVFSLYALQLIILRPWKHIKYSDDLYGLFIINLPVFPLIVFLGSRGLVELLTKFSIKPFKHLSNSMVVVAGIILWFVWAAVIYACVKIYFYILN